MSESPAETHAEVVIAIVRTGGIAGMRRRWRVEAQRPDAADWLALIDRCPWDDGTDADTGADRFVWSIRVRTPSAERERELPDSALDGPWLALVQAVREAPRSTQRPDPG